MYKSVNIQKHSTDNGSSPILKAHIVSLRLRLAKIRESVIHLLKLINILLSGQ